MATHSSALAGPGGAGPGANLWQPENYIYISHLGENGHWWWLPCCPETIQDSMESSFNSTTALGRSAPVFTYSQSGPRTVQVEIQLHRDIMDLINQNVKAPWPTSYTVSSGEDYTDSLIRALQSISVPKYAVSEKAVEPPLVAMRLSNEVFIKGIVNGNIGLEYGLPIISGGKYAQVRLSITITEVDPYDATTVFTNGSFRGVVQAFKGKMGFN